MGTGGRPTFVVSAPAADDRVFLQTMDGSTVAHGTLVDGAGVLSDPGAVAVAGVQGPSAEAVLVPPSDNSPRDDPFTVY
jgi:hypothetical protein